MQLSTLNHDATELIAKLPSDTKHLNLVALESSSSSILAGESGESPEVLHFSSWSGQLVWSELVSSACPPCSIANATIDSCFRALQALFSLSVEGFEFTCKYVNGALEDRFIYQLFLSIILLAIFVFVLLFICP
jgi:hypothetical protein